MPPSPARDAAASWRTRRDRGENADVMNILLLGAGGFVGSHLVEHLVAGGEHEIVALDVTDEKLAHVDPHAFTFHQADIRHASTLVDRLIREAEVVVDLIAYANPSIYVTAPLDVFELNFVQNLEIAKRCARHGKRLIQYSSAEVYGKAAAGDTACREDESDSVFGPVHRQRWIYANGKQLLERVLYAMGAAGDLEYTILRPFNFLGPRIDYLVEAYATGGPRVFPHFMSALLTGGPIRLVDGGLVHRAFLDIRDANEAFQTVLTRRVEARHQTYNVGNPRNNVTIREFALLMIEIYESLTGAHVNSAIVEVTGEEFYGRGYEDGDRLPPDVAKLRAVGWQPRRDLRETLTDTMRYYRERYVPSANGRMPETSFAWRPSGCVDASQVHGAAQ
jgi:UDP-apiose/xylose synthase